MKRGVDVLAHEQVRLGLAQVVAQLVARVARDQHGAREVCLVLGAVVADVDERPAWLDQSSTRAAILSSQAGLLRAPQAVSSKPCIGQISPTPLFWIL